MRNRWNQFSALTPVQRRAFLLALVALPVVVLAKPWRTAWVRRCLEMPGDLEQPAVDPAELLWLRGVGSAVNAAACHGLVRANCLERSLVLVWLLQRWGWGIRLRFGGRLLNGGLDAHAWVESSGQPINDKPDIAETYLPFEGDGFQHARSQSGYSYMIARNRFRQS